MDVSLKVFWPRPLPSPVLRICCYVACLFLAAAGYAANPIQTENAKPGSTEWEATNLALNGEIQGYASLTSVNRGGQISFFISTSDPSYTVDIFRMGWYGGAGGRRMLPPIPLSGTPQPIPTPDPITGLIECNWSVSLMLNIPNNTSDPSDWASGVYLAKLTGAVSGKQRYIIFVLRDDARSSDYFFQTSVSTYQAYNNWGGKSLYDFTSTNGRAYKVSFNRPYAGNSGIYSSFVPNDGAGDFLRGWEYNMVRFLEREGYDVTYGTDVDVHENPNLLPSHKAVLIVGHGEYWSWQMRSNIIAARDQGVSLGFFSANTCFWQVRFEPSALTGQPDRTMVGYKEAALALDPDCSDPLNAHLCTTLWSNAPVNLPANAFIGVIYRGGDWGMDTDIVVADSSNWVFNTTGLKNGDHLRGLQGFEADEFLSNPPPPAGTLPLASSPFVVAGTTTDYRNAVMTVYTAASGATVFADGTEQFSWGLDDFNAPALRTSRLNPAAQQIVRNILARFINDQPPLAKPGGPYEGLVSQPIQFDGRSSFDPDGRVTTYEWSFGDGATGTAATPTHTYSAAGTYVVTLIVTDGKGSRNAASTTANVVEFSLSAPSHMAVIDKGTDSTDFTVSASSPVGFKGSIQLGCSGNQPAVCKFNPGSIAAGQSATLTVSNLKAVTGNSLHFAVIGTSGSQAALLSLEVSMSDFSLSVWPTKLTTAAGQVATLTLTLSPTAGFDQAVTFACSGAPPAGDCSILPSSVTLNGASPSEATVAVTTSVGSMATPRPHVGPPTTGKHGSLPILLWLLAMVALTALRAGPCRRRAWRAGPAVMLLGIVLWAACGGGGGNPGTPLGTYTITITATSKSLSHKTQVNLTVN